MFKIHPDEFQVKQDHRVRPCLSFFKKMHVEKKIRRNYKISRKEKVVLVETITKI